MPRLNALTDLSRLRQDTLARLTQRERYGAVIAVGMGTCGIAAGARETFDALQRELTQRKVKAVLSPVGCIGICAREPLVEIRQGGFSILYGNVTADMAARLIEEHVLNSRPVKEWVVGRMSGTSDNGHLSEFQAIPLLKDQPFFGKQLRIALQNCGVIDPEQIDEYIARDGYFGLAKVLTEMPPEAVIKEVKEAGLRGRGGAGFLTGLKWELCRKSPNKPKYVICNADEGDPGAFMDRSILESDPHSVLEGMTIAGFAMGATQGYIYCREEYPLAIARLQSAIEDAHEYGLLGTNILGSGFDFDIALKEGAGAFVCGEETALMSSIEGHRGEPRPRPPFPAVAGLFGQPSNINNVKSYAMTPQVIVKGAKWFSGIGSPKSPGTAVFALTGKIKNTGLVEVPMGVPLGDIVFDIGGGVPKGKHFKAVQTGGPLGGCLPASCLNTPVDFDSLQAAGAVMGSGGMIVVDDDTCMVEFARYFLTFAAAESCGKCVPCRAGGRRLLEALERITQGHGTQRDLDVIKEISDHMMSHSLCGLGQRTPGPVLASLRFFEHEFIEHVENKLCAAGQCRPLVRAKCINTCPAGVDTPAYLGLIAQGKYAEALDIHRERNPFPMICGRACPAFCETKCRRGEVDDPIAIRLVKRFMGDHEANAAWKSAPIGTPEEHAARKGKKVAVIGSGPAGLTAALRLVQMGYGATVFEKLPLPGGMMSWAIPDYRLPRKALFGEIDKIRQAGVTIECNQALGRDFTLEQLLGEMGFSAVVLAIGAHNSRTLGIPGEQKSGVVSGIDFLRNAAADACAKATGLKIDVTLPDLKGKKVGIVGGGDVAIDAARTALRFGAAEVHVMYRRSGDDMPATHLPEEVESSLNEGVRIHTLANPVEVLGGANMTGVKIQRQRLTDFDLSARRKAQPIGETYTLNLDVLMPAIGQMPDIAWNVGDVLKATSARTLVVDAAYATSKAGVFAAGDVVSGPATIVQAVAQGNLVAVSVDTWIRTGKLVKPRFQTQRHDVALRPDIKLDAPARRPETPRLPVAERIDNFREIEPGFDEKTAQAEACRCLRCDLEWLDLMGIPRPTNEDEASRGNARPEQQPAAGA
jgi:NADH-quinone oxidoreductase subunit F